MRLLRNSVIAVLFAFAYVNVAQAGVIIGGTRVIYDGAKRETSLNISNPDSSPYLIQTWIEGNGANKAPFVMTPPLYRLDAGQKNALRIMRVGVLDETKESMY